MWCRRATPLISRSCRARSCVASPGRSWPMAHRTTWSTRAKCRSPSSAARCTPSGRGASTSPARAPAPSSPSSKNHLTMQTLPLLLSVLTLVTVGATFLATRQTKRTMLETCLTREDMASFGGGLTDNLTRSLTDTLLRALVASDPVKHELEAACHRAFANALHVLSIEIDDEEIEKIANVVVENMTEAWLQSGALDVDAPVAPSAPMTWPARPAPQAVAAGLETIEPAPHRVMHG